LKKLKQSTTQKYYGKKLIDICGMLIGQKNSVMNKHMVSAIVIIAKQQPQHTYIVRAEDWLNPSMYVIDAQDPYTGDTTVIYILKEGDKSEKNQKNIQIRHRVR
jgi:hypothetical protein